MPYQVMQFMCGTDRPQGYVLVGTDEHQGTSEPISVSEMEREATAGARLARFLDSRFLRAHGERIARDMGIPAEVEGNTVAPPSAKPDAEAERGA
ncbi:hypothetical protein [Sphingomonas sp. Marseille-Q8236]